jgi:hypothetical protein
MKKRIVGASIAVICDVGAGYHASQGMIAKFTVGTFDFTTFKWTA